MIAAPAPAARPGTALLLGGGGARAAYQVGVLQALVALRRHRQPGQRGSPFDIIIGTSAGAINAAALAAGADRFGHAVAQLARVWRTLRSEQIYHAGALQAARAGTQWLRLISLGWALARWRRAQPRSLLDNQPLRDMLQAQIPLRRLPRMLADGHLRGLGVTASCYANGEHVTFYEAVGEMHDWSDMQRRRAVRTPIAVDHLMASSAIPFVFPAAAITQDGMPAYYGDGAMRQTAPLSPAIHLGAERVLVVGVGRAHHRPDPADLSASTSYPSLAEVAGHALSSIFLDTLSADVERLERVNHTLALVPPERRSGSPLRPIELLSITPSLRLDEIAARHVQDLPSSMRALLGMLGVRGNGLSPRSAAFASYLLFEPGFTRELIRLGWNDALAQRETICRFFGWLDRPAAAH